MPGWWRNTWLSCHTQPWFQQAYWCNTAVFAPSMWNICSISLLHAAPYAAIDWSEIWACCCKRGFIIFAHCSCCTQRCSCLTCAQYRLCSHVVTMFASLIWESLDDVGLLESTVGSVFYPYVFKGTCMRENNPTGSKCIMIILSVIKTAVE